MKIASVGLVALCLLWGYIFLKPTEQTEPLPAELVGLWTSEEERYSDRFLRIQSDSVTWGQGESQASSPLVGFELEETEGHPIARFTYGDDGDLRTTSFYFDEVTASLFPLNRPGVRWNLDSDD